jgi:hypothetical protein
MAEKKQGRRREEVLVSLQNYAKMKMDLVAVGRENENGSFPNPETKLVLRKWHMTRRHSAELLEISIPPACVREMGGAIDQFLKTAVASLEKDSALRAGSEFHEHQTRRAT